MNATGTESFAGFERDVIYRRRRFPRDIIDACVRWYLTYRLDYRDVAALMAEWGVHLTHTTVMRWVQHYVPEYETRWNRPAKPTGSVWRVDKSPAFDKEWAPTQ